jgi:hypothetical protein
MPKLDKIYTQTVIVRLTKQEKDKLRELAQAHGLKLSAYIRLKLFT